jgi:hypothetical protein
VTITDLYGEIRISVAGVLQFLRKPQVLFRVLSAKPLINLSKFYNLFMQFLLHTHTEKLWYNTFDLYASNPGNII